MRLISHRKNTRYRMILAAAALAVFLLPAFTPDARAADSGAKVQDSKWYASFNVPVMFIDDSESVSAGAAPFPGPGGMPMPTPYTSNATNEYDTGFRISGAVGYEFGTGLRVEGELFFARADVSKLTYTGISTRALPPGITVPSRDIPVSGPADQFGGMLNLWYDFSTASRWKPYIGGGLGYIRVDQSDLEYDPQGPAQAIADVFALIGACRQAQMPPGCNLSPQVREYALSQAVVPSGTIPDVRGADTGFVYQFGLGVGYEYSDAITFQVGYRLIQTSEFEFAAQNATASVKATTDLRVHLFEIGVRYRF